MNAIRAVKAIANERRLQILEWLKNPVANFSPQMEGDLVKDGVCGNQIAEKLGMAPATVSVHMNVLLEAGFVRAKRIKQWTFYQRDEKGIAMIKGKILNRL